MADEHDTWVLHSSGNGDAGPQGGDHDRRGQKIDSSATRSIGHNSLIVSSEAIQLGMNLTVLSVTSLAQRLSCQGHPQVTLTLERPSGSDSQYVIDFLRVCAILHLVQVGGCRYEFS